MERSLSEFIRDEMNWDTLAAEADEGEVDKEEPSEPETPEESPPEEGSGESPAESEEAEGQDGGGEPPAPEETEAEEERAEVESEEDRAARLRWEDYTRKTQALAEERRRIEAERAAERALLEDLYRDEDVVSFLRKHPAALPELLKNPEEARRLIGNAEALADYWEDYEALQNSPRLKERLSRPDPRVVAQEAQERAQAIRDAVVADVDAALDVVAQEFGFAPGGEEVDQVTASLLAMAGVADPSTVTDWSQPIATVYRLLFRETPDGVRIDPTILRREFARIREAASAQKEPAEDPEVKHNTRVLKKLESQKRPVQPAGPGSRAPGEPLFEGKPPDSFEELLRSF